MLSPKNLKYRKRQRRIERLIGGKATRGASVSFGEYGMMSLERGFLTNRQIEAARIAMTRHIKRGGKVWIRVFPDVPYTKKPAETRMGKGKGSTEAWLAAIRPGRILFELSGVDPQLAERALCLAGGKLPIKTKFVVRR